MDSRRPGPGPMAWLRFLKLTLRGLIVGVILTDPLRAWHLKQGDVIACVSPKAAEHYRKLCRIYGGAELADRVAVVPHAVESRFRFPADETPAGGLCRTLAGCGAETAVAADGCDRIIGGGGP